MRFAWLREQSGDAAPPKTTGANRVIFIVYNLIWWLPLVLTILKVIDYRTGLVFFFVITAIRAIVNVYRNNFLSSEQAEVFPLRAP